MILALAGNQNCGKTTLFNQLTGSNQHVGNFPGVTVEQKSGEIRGHKQMSIVDLPGIYSIRPYSSEEIVTRDFLLQNKPDGIINIVDATNIERNLYLTLQMMDLRIPMVVALNMMDEVRANGWSIDVKKLSEALGMPVVPISAAKNEGVSELVDVLERTVQEKTLPTVRDLCSPGPVHRCIHSIMHQIEDHATNAGIPRRFAATKLIEGDKDIQKQLLLEPNELESIEHCVCQMEEERGLDRNAALADMRYSFIEAAVAASVHRPQENRDRTRSEKLDAILTNRYAAVPIFLGVMLLIFWLTFDVLGALFSDWLAMGIDALSAIADAGLTAYGISPVVHSLIIDGIFQGVGSVLSFLPIIVVLFFFLSILEDTGYMARVAFVMDSLLRKIGLSGRSIVPMLIGFGCTVPAVMSARTLSSERDRKMTILLTPFMSCSAKIPIYAIIAAAFFPGRGALCMVCLYAGGILAGILSAKLMGQTVLRGKPVPFVMELPNYRLPSPRSVLLLMWEKAKDFLERAFTIIFVATLAVWFLQTFDTRLNVVTDSSLSLLAAAGRSIAIVFAPLGFGDWRVVTALVSGFIAKESVISTLEMLTNGALSSLLTARSAISFLVFTLLYAPCVAAISAFKRELASGWKAAAVVIYQCAFAWLAAFLVYQLAGLLL
ncbi:MAG: ferrous iron transport protein B [Faecalibacterium sp.]|jgi:ferrous iron transport protein B|nr:ferrous iron transport protein B [Faecalibacterium sp.]